MPRHPAVSPTIAQLRGGVFSRLAHKIAGLQGERYPLHVGDTWMEPMEGARMEDLTVAEHPGMHRYSVPHGHPELLAAIEARKGVDRGRVLVSAGATGGLGAVAGALLDPGEEVLILAPFWPLIPGIVRCARGVPVEVPAYDRPGRIAELVEAAIGPRTVALYLNSPSNPTGRVLARAELADLAEVARAHDLWIWSDEVYEDYAFNAPHVPMRELAPERTFTALSFSKAYGMAGNRCGYVIGPTDESVMLEVRKIGTHSFYAAPTSSQLAAARVLRLGAGWVAQARASYRSAGEAAAAALGLPAPGGGTFLFANVEHLLDERGLHGFLLDCLDDNLLLAPGSSCGEAYGGWVRLCFTSAPPEVVARAVARLADRLGRVL